MLEIIDKWLGKLYFGIKKVVSDSGDFIQGFKKMITKELDAVIQLMFDLGIKLCLLFIGIDIALYLIDRPYWQIHPVSKIIALLVIVAYKYKVTDKIKGLRRVK